MLKKNNEIVEIFNKASKNDIKILKSFKTLQKLNFIELPKLGFKELNKIIKKSSKHGRRGNVYQRTWSKNNQKMSKNTQKSSLLASLFRAFLLEGVPIHHFSPLGYRKTVLKLLFGLLVNFGQFLASQHGLNFGLKMALDALLAATLGPHGAQRRPRGLQDLIGCPPGPLGEHFFSIVDDFGPSFLICSVSCSSSFALACSSSLYVF